MFEIMTAEGKTIKKKMGYERLYRRWTHYMHIILCIIFIDFLIVSQQVFRLMRYWGTCSKSASCAGGDGGRRNRSPHIVARFFISRPHLNRLRDDVSAVRIRSRRSFTGVRHIWGRFTHSHNSKRTSWLSECVLRNKVSQSSLSPVASVRYQSDIRQRMNRRIAVQFL